MILYHAIVRALMRGGFKKLAATRNAAHIVAQFAPAGVLVFAGDGALGGKNTGRAEIAAWFAKLLAFFPDFRLEPVAIVVDGWPWATRIATRFTVSATLPDGSLYTNEGMQFVRLSFGRILEDRIYEDTAKLELALDAIGSARGSS